MTPHVLQGVKASALLAPPAGEGVTELVKVKSLDGAVLPHLLGEAPAVVNREQLTNSHPEFCQ